MSTPPSIKFLPTEEAHRDAVVKWKIKGAPDGPTYIGDRLLRPCPACTPRTPGRHSAPNPPPAEHTLFSPLV